MILHFSSTIPVDLLRILPGKSLQEERRVSKRDVLSMPFPVSATWFRSTYYKLDTQRRLTLTGRFRTENPGGVPNSEAE